MTATLDTKCKLCGAMVSPLDVVCKCSETTDTEGLRLTDSANTKAAAALACGVMPFDFTEERAIRAFRALSRALVMDGGQTMEPPIFTDELLAKLEEWLIVETGNGEFAAYVARHLAAARAVRGCE